MNQLLVSIWAHRYIFWLVCLGVVVLIGAVCLVVNVIASHKEKQQEKEREALLAKRKGGGNGKKT